MHLITLFRVMNPHYRCLQAKVENFWDFDTEFATFFNKPYTYITFKSAVKHRQLIMSYGYPRGQTVHLAEAITTQDTHFSI